MICKLLKWLFGKKKEKEIEVRHSTPISSSSSSRALNSKRRDGNKEKRRGIKGAFGKPRWMRAKKKEDLNETRDN